MLGTKIIDLHGNIFTLGNWHLKTQIPIGIYDKLVFTKDTISLESFNLAIKGNKFKAYFYSLSLNLYICFKLTLKGYDESKDIRKAYLYGKRKNK